jgi:hypothetical protein
MNKQFSFTTAGVDEWRTEIYNAGQAGIDQECNLIQNDFVGWLVYRFQLTAAQTAFLISLGTLTHQSYSATIQNALQHRGPITLEKEELAAKADDIRNPKVILSEQRAQANANASTDAATVQAEIEIALIFKIFYLQTKK